MPFKIITVKGGFKVKNTDSKKVYSKKPMTKKNVKKQLNILKKYDK